jgi:putative transposase
MRKAYPSDLTDERWEIIRPLIPVSPLGRPRTVDMREVLNTIFSQARSGCQWDLLPHDLQPKSTVDDQFAQWRDDGTWQRSLDALRQRVRVAAGRGPAPSAGCIDSPTVTGTEMGGDRGHDGGKKLRGRKRPIVVDTLGVLLAVAVTGAWADDGTAAPEVLGQLSGEHSSRLKEVWADQKYRHHARDGWLKATGAGYAIEIEVVERPEGAKGFVLLRRRGVVERTFAWRGRYRRNSRDDELYTQSSESMIKISSIHLRLRKLTPGRSKRPNPFNYREIIPG